MYGGKVLQAVRNARWEVTKCLYTVHKAADDI